MSISTASSTFFVLECGEEILTKKTYVFFPPNHVWFGSKVEEDKIRAMGTVEMSFWFQRSRSGNKNTAEASYCSSKSGEKTASRIIAFDFVALNFSHEESRTSGGEVQTTEELYEIVIAICSVLMTSSTSSVHAMRYPLIREYGGTRRLRLRGGHIDPRCRCPPNTIPSENDKEAPPLASPRCPSGPARETANRWGAYFI